MKKLHGKARQVLLTAVVAGVVAAAIGGVSRAHAAGSPRDDDTMTLTETQTASKFISISHTKNGGPGDEFTFHSIVTDHSGARVGTLDVLCVVLLQQRIQCQGTYTLPGGTISGTALSSLANNGVTHVAINGGTGRYDRVHGQVTSTPTGNTTTRSVFDID